MTKPEVIRPQNPGGSSSGSAVAVAAGYAPLALGGEACGSIGTPASRAALYALKRTPGSIETTGMLRVAPTFETPGGMAKTPADLAALIKIIKSAGTNHVEGNIPETLLKDFTGMTLGFVSPEDWQLPAHLLAPNDDYAREVKAAYEEFIHKIEALGAWVHYHLPLTHPFDPIFEFNGQSGYLLILREFDISSSLFKDADLAVSEIRDSVNKYLQNLESSGVRTMADIIQFNKDHPGEQANLDQLYHIQAQEDSTSKETANEARAAMRKAVREQAFDKVIDGLSLDMVIAPMDSLISTIVALAGYPIGTMPLGALKENGRPYGFAIVAKAGQEGKILSVMSAYKAHFPPRPLPAMLEEAQRTL